METPPVPRGVTVGRILLVVESALWLAAGIALAVVVALIATGVLHPHGLRNGHRGVFSGSGGVAIAAGIGGVIVLALAGTGLWAGIAMGRLNPRARTVAIVLAWVGLAVGLLTLVSARPASRTAGPAIRGSSILGAAEIVLNAAILWALGLSGSARRAFRWLPAGAGPGPEPIPPEYPAWAQGPPPDSPPAAGYSPPPPPPPPAAPAAP